MAFGVRCLAWGRRPTAMPRLLSGGARSAAWASGWRRSRRPRRRAPAGLGSWAVVVGVRLSLTMSRTYAFVDTMVFLHFRQLDEIDWTSVLGAGEVEIVVAPVVWRQLDRHKDRHPASGLRERAKTSVRKLRSWLGTSGSGLVRPGVTVRLGYSDPKIDFAAWNLSREVEDDQLVATLIECQESLTEPIVLVTADYLLAAKARAVEVRVVEPPETDRLPDASSEEELRIRKLEAENQRLRARRPELTVTFASGSKHQEVRLQPLGERPAGEKEKELARVKAKYPLRGIPEYTPVPKDQDPFGMAAAFNQLQLLNTSLTRQQDLAYNQELQEFYREYDEFLDRDYGYRYMLSRALEFSFVVANDGTAPARDIDVVIKVRGPRMIQVVESGDMKPPRPPKLPSSEPFRPWSGMDASFLQPPFTAIGPTEVSASVRDADDGQEIHAYIHKLKQKQQETFGPFTVIFASSAEIGPLQLCCTLNTEDLPENVEETLHLVVTVAAEAR